MKMAFTGHSPISRGPKLASWHISYCETSCDDRSEPFLTAKDDYDAKVLVNSRWTVIILNGDLEGVTELYHLVPFVVVA